jgi:hypothetical protein
LPLPAPLDGTHIRLYRLIIDLDTLEGWCQANGVEELLRAAMPPDEQMLDLIERAFLEGQIDGRRADLAYFWLKGQRLTGI